MLSLTVVRTEYNLRNGVKKQAQVFYMQHELAGVANNILNLLLNSQSLEGGDVVIFKRNNKVVRKYSICNICCKNAVEKNSERCAGCTTTIGKTIGVHQSSGLQKALATLPHIQQATKANKKNKCHDAKSTKTENQEQYPPTLPFLRDCFR